MAQAGIILECDFAFKCPKQWADLNVLIEPEKRHCSTCERDVFFITTRKEFEEHQRLGHCVAADVHFSDLNKLVTIAGGASKSGAASILVFGDQENADELTVSISRNQRNGEQKSDSGHTGESQT